MQLQEDTYITIEEMRDYIDKNYVSTDPLRIQWNSMSVDDQQVFLRKAYQYICSLPFTGKPANADQDGPFPRAGIFTEKDFLKIKYAQAEQALALSDIVASQELTERLSLRRAGVIKYSIGDLSEQFQNLSAVSNSNYFGLSENAYNYLSKWLRGGYNICTSIKKPCGIP